jgi:hypothetical protein
MKAEPCKSRAEHLLWYFGAVWTLPNTCLGVLLGLLNGTIPRFESRTVNFYMGRGIVCQICDRLGISAFTLGDCVLYCVEPTRNLRVHESRHITQCRVFGPLFLPTYFLLLALRGYEKHPLERDARQHEQAVCGSEGPSRLRR